MPIGLPAGSNNYDDPDDPGQSGQNTGGSDGAIDAYGRACLAARDCPADMACSYPIANGCSAQGSCLPYTTVTGCSTQYACGCDGTNVPMCAPPGYALKPVTSLGACDAGVVTIDAGSDANDASSSDAASDVATD